MPDHNDVVVHAGNLFPLDHFLVPKEEIDDGKHLNSELRDREVLFL